VQFSLASLFLFVTSVALCTCLACNVSIIASLGTALAAMCFALFLSGRRTRVRPIWQLGAAALGLIALWVAAFDAIAYFERCELCGSCRYCVQHRVYGVVFRTRYHSELYSFKAIVGTDIGAPCRHRWYRVIKARQVGLIYEVRTGARDEVGLTNGVIPDWYEQRRSQLQHAAHANPSLRADFYTNVFVRGDEGYWHRFCDRLRTNRFRTTADEAKR